MASNLLQESNSALQFARFNMPGPKHFRARADIGLLELEHTPGARDQGSGCTCVTMAGQRICMGDLLVTDMAVWQGERGEGHCVGMDLFTTPICIEHWLS